MEGIAKLTKKQNILVESLSKPSLAGLVPGQLTPTERLGIFLFNRPDIGQNIEAPVHQSPALVQERDRKAQIGNPSDENMDAWPSPARAAQIEVRRRKH